MTSGEALGRHTPMMQQYLAHQGAASGHAGVLSHGRLLRVVLRGRRARGAASQHHADRRAAPRPARRSAWPACRRFGRAVPGEAGQARRSRGDLRADRRPGDAARDRSSARCVRVVTPGTLTDTGLLSHKSDARAARDRRIRCSGPAPFGTRLAGAGFAANCARCRRRSARAAPPSSRASRRRKCCWPTPGRLRSATSRPSAWRSAMPRAALVPDWHFDAAARRERCCASSSAGRDARSLRRRRRAATCSPPARRCSTTRGRRRARACAHVTTLRLETESDYVALDAATRRNLEITRDAARRRRPDAVPPARPLRHRHGQPAPAPLAPPSAPRCRRRRARATR